MAARVTNKHDLPAGFLDGPAPNLSKTVVDFKKAGLPEYEKCWAVLLDGVLSEEECKMLLTAAEARTNGVWERAMVNIGGGFQALYEDTRKCGRIIWDDRELVGRLWARVEAAVPDIHRLENWPNVTGIGPMKRNEVWKMSRLNERMRFLKYVGGEYFKEHMDGSYETDDGTERSYFTLHLYLNDAKGQLKGGATTFHSLYDSTRRVNVVPKSGRVLLFQHRGLMHSGEDVEGGVKYTMRTDIMYARETKE